MYPFFQIFGITIFTFGLALVVSFGMFVWMLKRLNNKFNSSHPGFFIKRISLLFFSTFFFSRLFYIISHFQDFLNNDSLLSFFIMPDYNLSLIGGIYGFLGTLYISVKKWNFKGDIYIDIIVLSFLFAGPVGYIGAFLGGQIYGMPTDSSLGILINNPIVEYQIPIFPIALFYAFIIFLLFNILYILKKIVKIDGLIGYSGIFMFSIIIISFEGLFGNKYGLFVDYTGYNLSQLGAFILLLLSLRGFKNIYFKSIKTNKTNNLKNNT